MANLVELYDLVIQAQSFNGVPLSHGHVYVYALGRTKLMDTWSDIDGESLNTNPVILDNAGQAHIYVSDDFDYTLVFTDEYDNEVFSVDKYLLSKGEHSHADVAVAPSEHIGVSSYHVGEVTVYVPYLTGEVGKTYEGIDPIVVNNTLNRISANHIPLGVQDPLYFVEDSESACIIGMSGGIVPEGTMVESSLGFENNKITGYNGSAFSAGNEYEAGNYISIDNNVINVTGLSPVPADMASTGLVAEVSADIISQIPSTAGLATTAQLDEKLDKVDSANFYPMEGNPSGFLTAHQSLQGYATEQWVEGKGYLTSVDIPESAVWNATTQTVSANSAAWAGGTANPQIPVTGINGIKISESGDKVVFEVSGDYYPGNNPSGFITGVDLSDYQTTAGMTAYQPAGDYLTTGDSAQFYTNDNPSGFITGVDLTDYATTAEVAEKQDITGMTAYQPAGDYLTTGDSANFYTTANESGFITGVDLTPYQEKADMTAYATTTDLTFKQDTLTFGYDEGNKISAINNSAIAGVTLTGDAQGAVDTIYSISGNIITGTKSNYNFTAGNVNNVTLGNVTIDGLNESIKAVKAGFPNDNWFLNSDILRLGPDFAPNYWENYQRVELNKTGLSSMSGSSNNKKLIWKALLNTDIEGADNTITAIAGSALRGGGDIPEGVMVESGLEYNADNKISGYAGSAFAGEEQVQSDWTMTAVDSPAYILNKPTEKNLIAGANVTITESDDDVTIETTEIASGLQLVAGHGVTLTVSGSNIVAAADETVLFETTAANGVGVCNLSESLKHFEKIRVLATRGWPGPATTSNTVGGFPGPWSEWETKGISADGRDYNAISPFIFEANNWKNSVYTANDTYTTLTWKKGLQKDMTSTAAGLTANSFTACVGIKKIVGINRISL